MDDHPSEAWSILIIDEDEGDYFETRSILEGVLGSKSHLDWASTYAEGQDLLQSNTYDAVLVDYDLGAQNGLELIRASAAQGYPAPLILYTDHQRDEIEAEAMRAGAAFYLAKSGASARLFYRSLRFALEFKRDIERRNRRLLERVDIFESIQDGVFSINKDWQITYTNQRSAHNIGQSPEDITGKNIWEAYPRLVGTQFETNYRLAMDERKALHFEAQSVYLDKWYSISVYPSTEGISIYSQDISERKRLEEEVHRQSLFPNENPNPVLRVSAGGDLQYANNSAQNILQIWERDKVRNLPEDLFTAAAATFTRGAPQELEVGCEERTFSFTLAPIPDQGYVNLYGVETTKRKQMEASLRESEERFRTMANGTPLIIFVTDAEGGVEFANRAFREFFGSTHEQVESEGLQYLIHTEDRIGYLEAFQESLRKHSEFHAEGRIQRVDGAWRFTESFGQPRYSSSGEFLGLVCTSVDITERKRAEEMLQRYTQQLKRSNEALEDFAFTASHELREPIRKVMAFSERLVRQSDHHQDEQSKDYLRRMVRAAERMQSMLDGLLAYSRVSNQEEPFEAVDLNRLAEEVVSDLEIQLRESGGKVELGELPVIRADRLQMRQLLQNLIENGIKFRKPGLPPMVKVTCRPAIGDCVEIIIEDQGAGFDMASYDQLFKPFRRLVGKSEYEGTGMGLAICQKIVERHQGTITAKGEPGLGATFTVTLPMRSKSPTSNL